MAGIWTQHDDQWTPNQPKGFPDEDTLIEQTPQVLPLAGAPQLVMLGREVPLGLGYADLVAVETGGQPVIIEVKPEQNSDARRGVVAQILYYAAHLTEPS